MEPLARLSRRRKQSHAPQRDASAHRCVDGWEPYTASRLRAQHAVEKAAGESRSRKTTRLSLLVMLCVAAALDMHALTARPESNAAVALEPVASVSGSALSAPRVDAAPAAHIGRQSPKRRVHASPPGTGFRPYSREEVKRLIRVHAAAYGIDADLPLAIAHCESGFKWNAANSRSSARGVFQYLSGTWRTTKEGRKGTSVFDTEAHIRMAVAHIATLGTAAWNASRGCWDATAVTETVTESVSEIFSES
jgi:hypothetical protein